MSNSDPPIPAVVVEALELTADITATSARLQSFAAVILGPLIAEQQKRAADAHSQRASADTLRNRAAKMPAGEHREELVARADRFERRATVMLEGGTMPRELRYPLDSLRLVSRARDALLAASDALDAIDAAEVHAFLEALQPVTGADRDVGEGPVTSEAPPMLVRNEVGRHLEMLGVYTDENGRKRARTFGLAIAMPIVAVPQRVRAVPNVPPPEERREETAERPNGAEAPPSS
jgi:hypothetical protein